MKIAKFLGSAIICTTCLVSTAMLGLGNFSFARAADSSGTSGATGLARVVVNPLLPVGPDPWVEFKHGFYYYMNTTITNLTVWKARTMADLKSAEKKIVWTAPADVLVMNMNEPPSLLRNNVSSSGHWLKVLLSGVKSNRSAIGARVTLKYGNRRQAQEVLAQSSFYSANDRRLHFGLGAATSADLIIRWPNGVLETIPNVTADQLVTIHEGSGIVNKQNFDWDLCGLCELTQRSWRSRSF